MSELKDPTQREYVLKCRLKFFDKDINEEVGVALEKKSYSRKMVFFIPQENDQRTKFLAAWLPEAEEEHFEMVGHIPQPIDSPCRFAIKRRGPDCNEHYLIVMSYGVEKDIVKFMEEGQIILIKILPADADVEADHATDVEGMEAVQ